jgi:predicted nuclease of restriction endonuclease-like (RecB) superfamily
MNANLTSRPSMPAWYPAFVEAVAAHFAADGETLLTYWSIGREILRWQLKPDWSSRTINHLAADLAARFPTRKGLSARNLRYMRAFAEAWPHEAYLHGPLTRLPWYHHLTLIQELDNSTVRLWYARESLENNWTRATLKTHITNNLYRRTHQPYR